MWRVRSSSLPRTGRLRKLSESNARRISRKIQNHFTTSTEIQTDLKGAGIAVSFDRISRTLHRTGVSSRSPRKVPLLKRKHVNDRLKFVETDEEKGSLFWEKK